MKRSTIEFNFLYTKLIIVGFLFFLSTSILAQNEVNLPFPIINPLNPFQNSQQSFDLGNPTNLNQSIVYDLETGMYIYSETLGNDSF